MFQMVDAWLSMFAVGPMVVLFANIYVLLYYE